MSRFLQRRLFIGWIAIAAFLFGALGPILAHAAASGSPDFPAGEICTASGLKLTHTSAPDEPPLWRIVDPAKHCGLCVAHDLSHALVSPLAVGFALTVPAHPYPPLFYQAPRPLFLWSPVSARAPPIA